MNPQQGRAREAARRYLCLGEVERLRELLPLGAHHVLVLLESLFKLQQLTRAERRPDPLGLAEGLEEISQLLGACGKRDGSA